MNLSAIAKIVENLGENFVKEFAIILQLRHWGILNHWAIRIKMVA
jgi:hypothetical protein